MEDLKKTLQNLIARDRVKQALKQMAELPEEQKGGMGTDITMLQQRLKKYTSDSRMGILDSRDASREKNQIVHAVLGIIEDLGTAVPVAEAPEPAPAAESSAGVTKILFLAANPTNTGQLRLGQEHREVEQSLRESSVREQFELTERFAVTSKSLFTALLDDNPTIVHFSGHGEMMRDDSTPDIASSEAGFRSIMAQLNAEEEDMEGYTGGIVVEDSAGKAKLVKADVLATLFGNISGIKCVILNACYSESQAKAILEQVPYVIGMNTAVPDKTAIMFATGFYRALGNGRDYENAFNLAKSLIELEGLTGADIPQIAINQDLLS